MTGTHDTTQDGPLQKAVDHWLAGLGLSLVLSLGVVALAHSSPHLREIQELGVDTTMRLREAFLTYEPIGTERPRDTSEWRTTPPGYVFIDLDADTCRSVEAKGALCDKRSPASAATAARVATAVLAANPRVLAIDVRLWDVNSDAALSQPVADLIAAAHPAGAAPVVAAAPATPTGQPGQANVDWSQVPRALADSDIHFAPAVVWPDGADGVVRRYPAAVCSRVMPREAGKPEQSVVTETLPRLAAHYAMMPSRNEPEAAAAAIRGGSSNGGCPDAGQSRDEAEADTPRTLFTLSADETTRAAARAHHQSFYNAFASSQVVDGKGRLILDESQFRDRVVLVGYSGASGLDRHTTPLGEMSGGEIVMNALRTFAASAVMEPEDLGAALYREFVVALATSLVFFGVFWLPSQILFAWAGEPAGWFRRLLSRGLSGGLFAMAVVGAAAFCVWLVAYWWGRAMVGGKPVDALMPLVVLSLEVIVETGAALIQRFHEGAGSLRRLSQRLYGAILHELQSQAAPTSPAAAPAPGSEGEDALNEAP